MSAVLWLLGAALAWWAVSWWRRRSTLLVRRSDQVVDLAEVRRLRALERAVERHPSGRAS